MLRISCPIKTSKEWIELLEKSNGNEEVELDKW